MLGLIKFFDVFLKSFSEQLPDVFLLTHKISGKTFCF
jgi:hypothetical protein